MWCDLHISQDLIFIGLLGVKIDKWKPPKFLYISYNQKMSYTPSQSSLIQEFSQEC
jgi:hypothetical protein